MSETNEIAYSDPRELGMPIPQESPQEDVEDDIASAYAEYDRFSFIAAKVIRFRGKTIEEWLSDMSIPEVASSLTPDELQHLNITAINLNEQINKNYAHAKSSFDLSTIKYQSAYNKEKLSIVEKCKEAKSRVPASELLETIVTNNIKDTYLAYRLSELFYEFWKSLHLKAKSFDGRLTSISMLHNMEKRNLKYES